eukprot:TRINITY_DN14184_c0_g1_i1.p1 TRINITY_DN14184_c0_g1~~TRINITY_DN14184_c0_g1_i1.p1  ORF type:complete len:286 (-),score=55.40 TRINITY_DN14184_c0_g1_i1:68-892(-)
MAVSFREASMELRSLMPVRFEISGMVYYVKMRVQQSSYTVIVTDLQDVWWRHSDENCVEQEIKTFNFLLAGEMESHLYQVRKYFSSQGDAEYSVGLDDDGSILRLSFRVQIDFYEFCWTLDCRRDRIDGSTYLKEHFLVPLLQICTATIERPSSKTMQNELKLARAKPLQIPEAAGDMYRRIAELECGVVPASESLTFSSLTPHRTAAVEASLAPSLPHASVSFQPTIASTAPVQGSALDTTPDEMNRLAELDKQLKEKQARAAAKAKKKRKFV